MPLLRHNRDFPVRLRPGRGSEPLKVLKRISDPSLRRELNGQMVDIDPMDVFPGEIVEINVDLSKGGPEWSKLSEAQVKEILAAGKGK